MAERPSIACDLDGLLMTNDAWIYGEMGTPIPGAVEFTHQLAQQGEVVVQSTRLGPAMKSGECSRLAKTRVLGWLDQHGFAFDSVWGSPGSPDVDAIISPLAIRCRPVDDGFPAYSWALNLVRRQIESIGFPKR